MALFDFLKKRDVIVDESTVSDPLLRALMSGETIDRTKALTVPTVSGAVDYIAGTIACMPIELFKRNTDGKIEKVKDSRVELFNGDTGDTLDGFQLKKAVVADYLLDGNGYIYIERERNEVKALKYLPTANVMVEHSVDPFNKFYKINCYDRAVYPYECIKLLRNTKDGATGTGVCSEVSQALETAYQTLLYELSLVKSGGNKKGFLKAQRKLGQDEIDVLKTAWRNLYSNNESNAVVLNNGLEFQEASNSSVEMQLNESKQTLADEIDTIFHITNDYYQTFKSAIYPIIKAFETAINRELLLEVEKEEYFFKFDTSEILKANLKERYEAYKIAKEMGLVTINELRRDDNRNDIEGLDVVDLGLAAVLYNVDTQEYYIPNTGDVKAEGIESKEAL